MVRARPKDVIKGLSKIKVDDINRVAFVRHALHRFLEDRWYYGHLQGGVVALTYWREVLDGQNIPAILSEYQVEGRLQVTCPVSCCGVMA